MNESRRDVELLKSAAEARQKSHPPLNEPEGRDEPGSRTFATLGSCACLSSVRNRPAYRSLTEKTFARFRNPLSTPRNQDKLVQRALAVS